MHHGRCFLVPGQLQDEFQPLSVVQPCLGSATQTARYEQKGPDAGLHHLLCRDPGAMAVADSYLADVRVDAGHGPVVGTGWH